MQDEQTGQQVLIGLERGEEVPKATWDKLMQEVQVAVKPELLANAAWREESNRIG